MRHLPADVKPANTGDAEAMAELFGGMIGALLSGIGLIFGVLILLFRSFFKPVIILAALPLCLVGAVDRAFGRAHGNRHAGDDRFS